MKNSVTLLTFCEGCNVKFSLAIQKKNRANLGQVRGHNQRLHQTSSQLPKEAWISEAGHHEIISFRSDILEKSKTLSKRKDAVLAVELVIQVGNQTDWRELPTQENIAGKKKADSSDNLKKLIAGVKQAAIEEFGLDRIISVDLHTDESTPHAHIVFAPIVNNKLQAKHWLDGAASCAQLREKLYTHVNQHIACDYVKGKIGGAPHDPDKAANAVNRPKKQTKQPRVFGKAFEVINSINEVKQLKEIIADLNQQFQNMFSRLKKAEEVAQRETNFREVAQKLVREERLKNSKLVKEVEALSLRVKQLEPQLVEAQAVHVKKLELPSEKTPKSISRMPRLR